MSHEVSFLCISFLPRSLKHFTTTYAKTLPWVPEDIFFLSILMVRGKAALTRRNAPRRKKCASLTRLRRKPSVSIRKKYPLEPRVQRHKIFKQESRCPVKSRILLFARLLLCKNHDKKKRKRWIAVFSQHDKVFAWISLFLMYFPWNRLGRYSKNEVKVFDFSLFLHDKFSCTIRKYLLWTCVLSKTKFFGLDISYTRGCLWDLRHVVS